MRLHYFDARGVFRVFETSIDQKAWRYWNEAPGFSQRFTGTFADDGNTIVGQCQLREDEVYWKDDRAITYLRVGAVSRDAEGGRYPDSGGVRSSELRCGEHASTDQAAAGGATVG